MSGQNPGWLGWVVREQRQENTDHFWGKWRGLVETRQKEDVVVKMGTEKKTGRTWCRTSNPRLKEKENSLLQNSENAHATGVMA